MQIGKVKTLALGIVALGVFGACSSTQEQVSYKEFELGRTTFECGDTYMTVDVDGLSGYLVDNKPAQPIISEVVVDDSGTITAVDIHSVINMDVPNIPEKALVLGELSGHILVDSRVDKDAENFFTGGEITLRSALVDSNKYSDIATLKRDIERGDIRFDPSAIKVKRFIGDGILDPQIIEQRSKFDPEADDVKRVDTFVSLDKLTANGFRTFTSKASLKASGYVDEDYLDSVGIKCEMVQVAIPKPFPRVRR